MRQSQIQINLPARVEKGMAATAGWANSIREAVGRLAVRGQNDKRDSSAPVYPPFTVSLRIHPDDPVTYGVYVYPGYVCERDLKITAGTECMIYWELDELIDEDGFPVEFEIEMDEAIFVHVIEDLNGSISDVEVVVAAKDIESTNSEPPSTTGEYYYKLASLETVDGYPQLVNFLAGSHIYHVSGLTGDVLLEDCSGDQYGDPIVPGVMLVRMSFVSGRLVALNATEEDRPLSANHVREQFTPCSESNPE